MAKQYLDLTGLKNVITQIKNYYAGSQEADAARVGWASNAKEANQANALSSPVSIKISSTDNVISASTTSFSAAGTTVDLVASIADATTVAHGLMTAAQVTKLNGIAANAQVNVLESVSITVSNTISTALPTVGNVDGNKNIEITLPQYALKKDIAAGINFKGIVATYSDLPSNAKAGDVYIVKDAGTPYDPKKNVEYIRVDASTPGATEGYWEELGNTIDLGGYYTKTEVDNFDGISGGKWAHTVISDWASTTVAVQNAVKAEQLKTARTIDFTGDVTGTQISFDGTTAVSTTLTIGAGKVTNAMLAGNIAQSKITNLTTDLASKMALVPGATVSNIAIFNANGQVEDGAISVNDIATTAAVATAISDALDLLDHSSTGDYATGVTQVNGKITSVSYGTKATAQVASSAATVSTTAYSLNGQTGLVPGSEVDKALLGTYYVTSLTVPSNVFDTTSY